MFLEYIFHDVWVLTIFEFSIFAKFGKFAKNAKVKICVIDVSSKKNFFWHLPSFYQNVKLSQTHVPGICPGYNFVYRPSLRMFLEYIFDDVCVLTIFEFSILQKMQKSKKMCVIKKTFFGT